MRVATQEEAQYAERSKQYEAAPWAAGRPGSLFDKPQDVLFSDMAGMSQQGKDFLRANDITHTGYWSPKCFDGATKQSWVWVQGVSMQVQQSGVELHLVAGSDNQELVRCMDVLEPLMLPIVIKVNAHRKSEQTLVGVYWSVLGYDTSRGLAAMFKTGDQWLVLFTRYSRTEIVYTARDRQDALDYCMLDYSEREDQYDNDDED